jgi:hypothetical protein
MTTLLDGETEQNLGKYSIDAKQESQLYFEPSSYFRHQTSMDDLGVSQQVSESNLSNSSFMTVNQNIDQTNFINNSAFQSMEFPSSSSIDLKNMQYGQMETQDIRNWHNPRMRFPPTLFPTNIHQILQRMGCQTADLLFRLLDRLRHTACLCMHKMRMLLPRELLTCRF